MKLAGTTKPEPEVDEDVLDDVNEEAEGLDDGEVEDKDTAEEDEVENEEEETSEDEDDSTEQPSDKDEPAPFDKKQQTKVNQLIKARLERQETKLITDLSVHAGVDLSRDELQPAARLWGLLKSNPQLSGQIDALITAALSDGSAKAPTSAEKTAEAALQRLELKEAILDLKEADPVFAKNSQKILAWADNEGYTVKDAKSLKLALLAWKGTQGKVAAAVQKTITQRKQEDKKLMQKRASVQSTKSGGKAIAKSDYRKMSDAAVLQSEGLSLFTPD